LASPTTPFPPRFTLAAAPDATRQNLPLTNQTNQNRHHGLFLVKSINPSFTPRILDTQAQADNIVAQVERRLAREAAQAHHQFHETTFPGEPLHFERETPMVVARRLFHSLMSLGRIA
jgi:hypothetical protein